MGLRAVVDRIMVDDISTWDDHPQIPIALALISGIVHSITRCFKSHLLLANFEQKSKSQSAGAPASVVNANYRNVLGIGRRRLRSTAEGTSFTILHALYPLA